MGMVCVFVMFIYFNWHFIRVGSLHLGCLTVSFAFIYFFLYFHSLHLSLSLPLHLQSLFSPPFTSLASLHSVSPPFLFILFLPPISPFSPLASPLSPLSKAFRRRMIRVAVYLSEREAASEEAREGGAFQQQQEQAMLSWRRRVNDP